MPLHFAVQFRDGCPIPGASLTPMDGEYVLVSNSYSDDILGGMWSPPFQVEIGLYSAVGTDEEQERDRIDDDIKYKLCTCCDNSGTSRRFH